MNNDKKFEVRVTKWVNGILSTLKRKFEFFADAKEFANQQEDAKIKIYDLGGEIIENKFKQKKPTFEIGGGEDEYL
jgi:hypothetical protein